MPTTPISPSRSAESCEFFAARAPAAAANFLKSLPFMSVSLEKSGVATSSEPPLLFASFFMASSAPTRSCFEVGLWTEASDMKEYAMSSLACLKSPVFWGAGELPPAGAGVQPTTAIVRAARRASVRRTW